VEKPDVTSGRKGEERVRGDGKGTEGMSNFSTRGRRDNRERDCWGGVKKGVPAR